MQALELQLQLPRPRRRGTGTVMDHDKRGRADPRIVFAVGVFSLGPSFSLSRYGWTVRVPTLSLVPVYRPSSKKNGLRKVGR